MSMANEEIDHLTAVITAEARGFDENILRSEKVLDAFEKRLGQTSGRVNDLAHAMTAFVTGPLLALGAGAVKSAMELDSLKRGLTAVAGSSQQAEIQMARLREVAKLPGLGFKEAVQGSVNLQAAGFSALQAEKSLMAFGNALGTVGKGKADLSGVILALSQIQTKGKVAAQEINQLSERVPQIRRVMLQAFGTADTEVLQKMGISSEKFIGKVTEELGKLPQVTGGIQNAFENAQDTINTALVRIGDVLARNLQRPLENVLTVIDRGTAVFEKLPPVLQNSIVGFAGVAAAIGPLLLVGGQLATAFSALAPTFAALGVAMSGPIGIAIATVTAVIASGVLAWKYNLFGFRDDASVVFSSVVKFVDSIVPPIMTVVQMSIQGWTLLGQSLLKLNTEFLSWRNQVVATLTSAWENFQKAFAGIVQAIQSPMNPFGRLISFFVTGAETLLNIVDTMSHGIISRLIGMGKIIGGSANDWALALETGFNAMTVVNAVTWNGFKKTVGDAATGVTGELGKLSTVNRNALSGMAQDTGDAAKKIKSEFDSFAEKVKSVKEQLLELSGDKLAALRMEFPDIPVSRLKEYMDLLKQDEAAKGIAKQRDHMKELTEEINKTGQATIRLAILQGQLQQTKGFLGTNSLTPPTPYIPIPQSKVTWYNERETGENSDPDTHLGKSAFANLAGQNRIVKDVSVALSKDIEQVLRAQKVRIGREGVMVDILLANGEKITRLWNDRAGFKAGLTGRVDLHSSTGATQYEKMGVTGIRLAQPNAPASNALAVPDVGTFNVGQGGFNIGGRTFASETEGENFLEGFSGLANRAAELSKQLALARAKTDEERIAIEFFGTAANLTDKQVGTLVSRVLAMRNALKPFDEKDKQETFFQQELKKTEDSIRAKEARIDALGEKMHPEVYQALREKFKTDSNAELRKQLSMISPDRQNALFSLKPREAQTDVWMQGMEKAAMFIENTKTKLNEFIDASKDLANVFTLDGAAAILFKDKFENLSGPFKTAAKDTLDFAEKMRTQNANALQEATSKKRLETLDRAFESAQGHYLELQGGSTNLSKAITNETVSLNLLKQAYDTLNPKEKERIGNVTEFLQKSQQLQIANEMQARTDGLRKQALALGRGAFADSGSLGYALGLKGEDPVEKYRLEQGKNALALSAEQAKMIQVNDQLQKVTTITNALATGLTTTFSNAFATIGQGFRKFTDSIWMGFGDMLKQMAAEYLKSAIYQAIFKSVFGSLGGNALQSQSQSLATSSLPGRAMGGSVSAYHPYMVGENGPEIFVPRGNGRIVPNHQLSGGGTTVYVTMHISTPDAGSFRGSQSQMLDDLTREVKQRL